MATANPFDLLGDNDNDDPSQLVALQQQKIVPKKAPAPAAAPVTKPPAKLPSKPAPPSQAVRDAKSEGGRGGVRGGGGGGRGYGRRGGGGYNREFGGNDNSFGNGGLARGQVAVGETDSGRTSERRVGYGGPRGGFHGGRRDGYSNGDDGEADRSHRVFERRSGTGRGNEHKREGSGRGNWGSQTDELSSVIEEVPVEGEKQLDIEKPLAEKDVSDGKEKQTDEADEKKEQQEDKEMTLEEYEKVLEEKRKVLEAYKSEERKVEIDRELAKMQQLSSKKSSDEIFVKLGSDKDKRKEIAEKDERAKKALSINEFLKPAEGEKYYSPGGRGRGRGRGSRGGFGGGGSGASSYAEAPVIGDPSEFPTLGAK